MNYFPNNRIDTIILFRIVDIGNHSYRVSMVWRTSDFLKIVFLLLASCQNASIHYEIVRYCSSLIFFNSAESLMEGVYKSTQCAQSVQLATREMMLPFDCRRLTHFQGSESQQQYLRRHSPLGD